MLDTPPSPLLSICISTYNAAHLLRVTLGAVLPQVLAAAGRVEVLVVDDGSQDDTPSVIEAARSYGPVSYVRNEKNLGSSANLVTGPTRHANGEFVWSWNQHCLLYPGALDRLLEVLDAQRDLNVLYVNFRCANYPRDWPEQAVGGYAGAMDYLGNQDLESRAVPSWQELVDPKTGVCTQSYAHLIKRSVWTTYWATREVGESYRNALTTYPHTYMLAESVFRQPSYYVGSPLLTIFNGAQSWGDLKGRAKVYLLGYPDLIRTFKRQGWQRDKQIKAERWGAEQAGAIMLQAFREKRGDVTAMLPRYLLRYGTDRGVVRAVWNAFLDSRCCWLARMLVTAGERMARWWEYCFHNCRPARWIRSMLGSNGGA